MRPFHLRVGNYINYTKGIDGTERHIAIVISTSEGMYSFENINGEKEGRGHTFPSKIDLDEEWFLKLGFKKRKEGVFIKLFVVFAADGNGDYHLDVNRMYKPVDSVHGLQNMFFALTGEELTI